MSEIHPTAPAVPGKPAKPRPDFPLFAHAAGVWAKKIRGKLHYFGPWDDPDAALKKYLEQKDDLHAGRKPRAASGAATVQDVCNEFLFAKETAVNNGELSPRTWTGYNIACRFFVKQLGKTRLMSDVRPDDFATLRNQLAKRYGLHGLGTAIQCIRCVCKYAYESDLIDRPIRFGPGFKRPSKKTLRLHRAAQGPKLFTAQEVRALVQGALVVGAEGPELVKATLPLRAMLLLGINAGFGNSDCGNLPLSAVNLDASMIDFPRPKTGIPRRCPLWPETVRAIREALADRPAPKDPADAERVFITSRGLPWAKDTNDCPVAKETAKLLKRLGINGRKGLTFYALRHTFRTIADEAKDQPAADFIMGHEVPHMSAIYRETISDERLKAVTDHVRRWLFAGQKDEPTTTAV